MENKNLSFEENMQRLEQIVRAMEKGDVPLESHWSCFVKAHSSLESAQSFWTKMSCR